MAETFSGAGARLTSAFSTNCLSAQTHAALAPELRYLPSKYKDWLPGVAGTQPRLCSGFGGSVNRGGLHRPPFLFSEACIYTTGFPAERVKFPLRAVPAASEP